MGKLILYGRGLIAEEYCRYLEGSKMVAFAVTRYFAVLQGIQGSRKWKESSALTVTWGM